MGHGNRDRFPVTYQRQCERFSFPALVPRLVSVDVLRGLVMVIKPVGYGHGLAFIYVMWILAVAILYLPCGWFMELRRRHRDWAWLSYL